MGWMILIKPNETHRQTVLFSQLMAALRNRFTSANIFSGINTRVIAKQWSDLENAPDQPQEEAGGAASCLCCVHTGCWGFLLALGTSQIHRNDLKFLLLDMSRRREISHPFCSPKGELRALTQWRQSFIHPQEQHGMLVKWRVKGVTKCHRSSKMKGKVFWQTLVGGYKYNKNCTVFKPYKNWNWEELEQIHCIFDTVNN